VTEALAFLSSDAHAEARIDSLLLQHPLLPHEVGGNFDCPDSFWRFLFMPDPHLPPACPAKSKHKRLRKSALTLAACLALADEVFAQATDPWTQAVQALQTAFTGPIATGLALVAIVVGGLMFAFGEGGAKRTLAGVVFGVGMAVGAVNFMSWLFP
jgi:type IV secretory pathway VirB2 component (pilin)